jgi:nucleoid-associated protein YgaU
MLLVVLCAACNLARATPTPLPDPTAAPTVRPAPTLFPSITPLGFFATLGATPPPASGGTVDGDCPIPAGWVAYVVQAGDSLFALANATGTTSDGIASANCLDDPDSVFVGQTLYLPRQPDVG